MNSSTQRPLISVVTVCLDAAEYIRQCIESVVTSDFDDFEYIVIDGGSRDGTVDIVRDYDERIAYWHSEPDRGLADAFNKGLSHARGQWIQFLNSDDYLADQETLSKMAVQLRSHPDADVVFGQIIVVARTRDTTKLSGPHGSEFRWGEFLRRDSIPHQAAFTNRKYFERVGAFSESYRIAVDYEHYLRGGNNITCVYVPLLVAHQRDGGLSRGSVRRSLREWAMAQVQSGGRNRIMAWSSFAFLVARSTLGKAVRTLNANVRRWR